MMRIRLFAAAALTATAAACSAIGPTEVVETVYYRVSVDPGPEIAGRTDLTLAVRPFATAEVLDRDGVYYRTSDVEGGYWTSHQWAEPVASMVRDAVEADLEASSMFGRVHILESAGFAGLLLDGEVHRFEEEDREDGWYAVVEVTIELSRAAGGAVYHRRFRADERCESRTVREVVRALGRGLGRILAELRADLEGALVEGGR